MSDLYEDRYKSLFDRIAVLRERGEITELSGGLTNQNLAIDTPSGKVVARISTNETSMLAIDREAEYQNSKLAAEVGIGAEVLGYLPGEGLLVISFINGKTFTAEDVAQNLARIAKSCRKLHSAKKFVSEFNMLDIQPRYLRTVQENGYRIPSRYENYSTHVAQIRSALSVLDEGTVPCNNDLLPANFIDDGNQVWLIDYEYSGNNDPCFELGNICSEAGLGLDALEFLVSEYYGEKRPEKFARAWLLSLMAKYGWTMWASIQNSISELDFDFWEWGMEKYDRAEADFNSPLFKEMLEKATVSS